MKKILLTLALMGLFTAPTLMAQDVEAPKSGAVILVENNKLQITPGQTQEIELSLLRSERAEKTKFDPISINGSKAVQFEITEVQDAKDNWTLLVTVPEGTAEGTYYYVMSSKSKGSQKVKGATLAVKVSGESVAVNND